MLIIVIMIIMIMMTIMKMIMYDNDDINNNSFFIAIMIIMIIMIMLIYDNADAVCDAAGRPSPCWTSARPPPSPPVALWGRGLEPSRWSAMRRPSCRLASPPWT